MSIHVRIVGLVVGVALVTAAPQATAAAPTPSALPAPCARMLDLAGMPEAAIADLARRDAGLRASAVECAPLLQARIAQMDPDDELDAVVCAMLIILAATIVVVCLTDVVACALYIEPASGDLFVLGELIWDCPPFADDRPVHPFGRA